MSSRSTKKATSIPLLEPIITRTKSGQKKQISTLQTKDKKTVNVKPKLTEIKSPKAAKKVIRSKESLLKNQDKKCDDTEQVEYYPNKLKRVNCAKKIMLKPKHNFKVIASTNKRKLATPLKGIKSPPPKKQKAAKGKSPKSSKTFRTSSPELKMQDMVRLMEETRSLSDEDFMEILTCPSPVWWEDPPNGSYVEDSIYTRSPEWNKPEEEDRSNNTNTTVYTDNQSSNADTEKNVAANKKDEKFTKKQLKLENVLGNIKNKTIKSNEHSKVEAKTKGSVRGRQLSESTEGECSDISFNEEEIIKNLENMDIPIETNEIKEQVPVKKEIENVIVIKNDSAESILPMELKTEIKEEILINSPNSNEENVSETKFVLTEDIFKQTSNTDENSDEIIILDSYTNIKTEVTDTTDLEYSSTLKNISSKDHNEVCIDGNDFKTNESDFFSNIKAVNDLTEYITVYKIIPEKSHIANNSENTKPTENINKTKGKLNNFFKQSKKKKRFNKTENPVPFINPLTDVKAIIDNEKEETEKNIDSHDDNRLKHCEYCIKKTVNGSTVYSCEKCELAPILSCDTCNFLADSKEVYKKHISTCKDIARISWNHNLVLNQT